MQAASARRNGWVYFLRSRGSGRIKIGFTATPERRFGQIAKAESCCVEPLATVPGTMRLEREMHEWFAHLRDGDAEWFRPEPDLLAFASALDCPFRGKVYTPETPAEVRGWWSAAFAAHVKRTGLSRPEIARQLGVGVSHVHYWLVVGSVPRPETRERIAAWSDGAVPVSNPGGLL
jgi:hypothetical protein